MINLKIKKAAMFGLDARIALAIFGALSVIGGAALYSAIQQAQAEAWRQYFEGIIKASEQYYLDSGQQLEIITTGGIDGLYIGDLIAHRNSLVNWKGPYLGDITYSVPESFKDNMVTKIHNNSEMRMYLRKTTAWTEMNDLTTDEKCTGGDYNCSEWITLHPNHPDAISNINNVFTILDALVDNGDGSLSGKVRFNSGNLGSIMYKGISHKR